jgi:uncharacterized sporulation protein YeaH/YhbH (DUF444 family)
MIPVVISVAGVSALLRRRRSMSSPLKRHYTLLKPSRLAEYLEDEPARKKAAAEAQKAKLEALERKLGITAGGSGADPEPLAGKKHRFDDTEYIEQSREIVDTVKSAVAVGV